MSRAMAPPRPGAACAWPAPPWPTPLRRGARIPSARPWRWPRRCRSVRRCSRTWRAPSWPAAPARSTSPLRERLRSVFSDGDGLTTTPSSPLLAALRDHEAGLTFLRLTPDECEWQPRLWEVHAALDRALPLAELRGRLDSADPATLPPAERHDLLALASDYFRDSCQPADLAAMLRFGAPGLGAGQLTDALAEQMHWHARDEHHDQSWIWSEPASSTPERETLALPLMAKAVAAIPWQDATAAVPAIERAYQACGTPAATLYLADQCAAHGLDAAAGSLRARVRRYFARAQVLADAAGFNRRVRLRLDEGELIATSSSLATAAAALAAGERYLKRDKDHREWDSIRLRLARAHALAGELDQAVDDLCRSFAAERLDEHPVYCVGDRTIDDTRGFRTWLLRRLAATPGFAALQAKVIAAAPPALVDDGFAAVLGVPRVQLGGAPKAGAADDF